jgi:uncharacterized membrane protein HdeD (DUF308 family)
MELLKFGKKEENLIDFWIFLILGIILIIIGFFLLTEFDSSYLILIGILSLLYSFVKIAYEALT